MRSAHQELAATIGAQATALGGIIGTENGQAIGIVNSNDRAQRRMRARLESICINRQRGKQCSDIAEARRLLLRNRVAGDQFQVIGFDVHDAAIKGAGRAINAAAPGLQRDVTCGGANPR